MYPKPLSAIIFSKGQVRRDALKRASTRLCGEGLVARELKLTAPYSLGTKSRGGRGMRYVVVEVAVASSSFVTKAGKASCVAFGIGSLRCLLSLP